MTNDELIQSVVCMLAIDRKIDDSEAQFLNSLCKHLGVSQKIVELAIKKAKQGKGRVHIPDEPAERKRLFTFLVQAATADGKVVHQEQKILDAVAAKFGIPNQEVEEAIRIWLPEAVATPLTAEISAKGSPHPPKAKAKTKPQHYNVVFQGKIVKGKKPEDVKKNLASLFKANITDIEKIFTGKPVVVKEKVSQEIALKFQEAFKQAGAVCRIEAITPPATAKKVPKKAVKQAAQQQAVQPGMMICPKCGFEQKKSPKCKQCSIFIKKYLEMQKAKQAEEKAIIEEAPAEISPNPKNPKKPKKPKKDDLLGQQLQQMVKAAPEESTAPSSKKRSKKRSTRQMSPEEIEIEKNELNKLEIDLAIASIAQTARYCMGLAGLILFFAFTMDVWFLLEALLVVGLAFAMLRFRSRVAAMFLVMYSILGIIWGVLTTFLILLYVSMWMAGGSMLIRIAVLVLSIRAFMTTLKLHGELAAPEDRDTTTNNILIGVLVAGIVFFLGFLALAGNMGWLASTKGTDMSAVPENFEASPLIHACREDNLAKVSELLYEGADIEERDTFMNATPVIWASINGNALMVQILIEYGASMDARANNGETALMHAAMRGHSEVIVTLLTNGANPDITDSMGATALQKAKQLQQHEVVGVFKRFGITK